MNVTCKKKNSYVDTDTLINLSRYPLHQRDSVEYKQLLLDGKQQVDRDGALYLEEFLSEKGLKELSEEANSMLPNLHQIDELHNVYLTPIPSNLPDQDPRVMTIRSHKSQVGYHRFTKGGGLDSVYNWPPLIQFIADLLGAEKLYCHDDPSNALVLSAAYDNEELGWHFDKATFSTTIKLQDSEAGGVFEYIPFIRSPSNENYNVIRNVLMGDQTMIQKIDQPPGTLVFFKGQFSLHRVTPVKGRIPRLLVILSYEFEPGVTFDPVLRKRFFGSDAPDV